MRINYHILSSKISNRQTFREYIHGASRYTQLVNMNFIRIKNSIKSVLYSVLKPSKNNMVFKTPKIVTKILILFHVKKKNEITFDDSSRFYIKENIKGKDVNTIQIKNNNPKFSVSELIKQKNDSEIAIQNTFSPITIREKIAIKDNDFNIENGVIHTQISVRNRSNDTNTIGITNGKVNASASYLTQLKMMSGSLNGYYNQTISDTGRKKVI